MKIKNKIKLQTPALTGQSGVIGKDIDIVTKKDSNGLPYFPATHIKGILRDRCEYMKELSMGFSVDKYFGKEGEDKTILLFSNLTLEGIENEKLSREKLIEGKEFLVGDRHGIKVDRKSKTTEDGSLFDYEFIS